jgi:zinc transport system substrate-binding protein
VTNKQVAAVVKMLTAEDAEVTSLVRSSVCPEHYHASPGDLKLLKRADALIYIDPDFDGFMLNKKDTICTKCIRISKFEGIKFLYNPSSKSSKTLDKKDYHIWLDLNNLRSIFIGLSKELEVRFPDIKQTVNNNLQNSVELIDKLEKIKADKLKTSPDLVLIDRELEYFFRDQDGKDISDSKIHLPCPSNHKSLKCIYKIEQLLSKYPHAPILTSDINLKDTIRRGKKTIRYLNIDDFKTFSNDSESVKESLYSYYLNIIDLASEPIIEDLR